MSVNHYAWIGFGAVVERDVDGFPGGHRYADEWVAASGVSGVTAERIDGHRFRVLVAERVCGSDLGALAFSASELARREPGLKARFAFFASRAWPEAPDPHWLFGTSFY